MKKYKYKISVIIPIYNVEKYIEDAIKSIIKQTIGFENIELILINDGSPANEDKICQKYASMYQNIKYIKQENQGVSAARNNGIDIATGKYLNFLDSDDKLEKDALEIGYEMLEKNSNINFVGFRQKFFEAANGYHAMDYRFTEENRIVDITNEYNCLQLSAAASLIRASALEKDKIRFDEKVKLSEDAKFMTDILFKNKEKKYGLISSSNYLYRRRKIRNSKIQTSGQDITSYSFTSKNVYEYVFNLSKKMFNEIIPYAQYFVMYHLQYKLTSGITTNLNKEEEEKHKVYLLKLLDNIEDYIIMEQKNISILDKIYILNIKHKKDIQTDIKFKKEKLYYKNMEFHLDNNYLINITNINSINNKLIYKFDAPKFLTDNLEIKINDEKIPVEYKNKLYGNYELFEQYSPSKKTFEIEIIKNNKNIIEFTYNNNPILINGNGFLTLLNSKFSEYTINKYSSTINKNKIIIIKKSINSLFKKILYYGNLLIKNKNSFLLSILFTLSKPLYKNKNINIVYINDKNEKEILKYYEKHNVDISNFIVIKNNKFSRSLNFKLKYLNAKNIYYDIDDIIINPFGKSYKYYINKTNTLYNIFINNKTNESNKEKRKNMHKETSFIKIK